MALLTDAKVWKSKEGGSYVASRYRIKDGTQLYEGQFVELDAGGDLIPFAATAGGSAGNGIPLGRVMPTKSDREDATYLKGDTTAPRPEAIVFTGSEVLMDEAVTGVAGQADVGKLVYLDATGTAGDRTLTLTSTTNGKPLGRVDRFLTGTRCDVATFDFPTRGSY